MRILTRCALAFGLVGCVAVEERPPVAGVLYTQEGTASVTMLSGEVRYPMPFLSKPNLEATTEDRKGVIMDIDERADGFSVTAASLKISTNEKAVPMKWKARGLVSKSFVPQSESPPVAAEPVPVGDHPSKP